MVAPVTAWLRRSDCDYCWLSGEVVAATVPALSRSVRGPVRRAFGVLRSGRAAAAPSALRVAARAFPKRGIGVAVPLRTARGYLQVGPTRVVLEGSICALRDCRPRAEAEGVWAFEAAAVVT